MNVYMKKSILLLLSGMIFLSGCKHAEKQDDSSKISVIFETDMGNDVDDALALDLLFKYADMGLINLLGVSTNKESSYSIEFLDVMKTWYGYPDLLTGKITKGIDCENDATNYAKATCQYQENGKSPFKRTHSDYGKIPESPRFYREILSKQPDQSVVIVSVGFSTNIARLLDTPPDKFSPLTGKELVYKKVKLLSMMAGQVLNPEVQEYNVVKDIPSAQKIFREWPSNIVISPFDVGIAILFPATVIEKNLNYTRPNPLKIAYESYLPMPYDRPTWDLTSVLYAVEGVKNYFNISPWGRIEVDDEAHTRFYPDEKGKHAFLSVSEEQAEIVKNRFVELISTKPKPFK